MKQINPMLTAAAGRALPSLMAASLICASVLGGCSAGSQEEVIVNEPAVQVKETLEASPYPSDADSTIEDYSWAELSDISKEIAAAGSDEEVAALAQQYGLVNADGKLDGSQVKTIQLADGTDTGAMIVGFAHDDATDGGKAGISFIFTNCIALAPMNLPKTNAGGWESSELRAWLASDGMALLPEDLQEAIVSVEKLSNNAGAGATADDVTITSDKLWLFSDAEICGPTEFYADEQRNAVVNAEGSQYQLFSDCGIDLEGPNSILLKNSLHNSSGAYATEDATPDEEINPSTRVWWLRTANPSNYSLRFRCIRSDGDPCVNVLSSYSEGVVPGFSL